MKAEDSQIISPIFVIGTGRCGLTPLMNLISYHRELAWPSQFIDRPKTISKLYLSYLNRIVDRFLAGASNKHHSRFIPKHGETYLLWESCFQGFRRPFRDLVADDVTINIEKKFKHVISKITRYHGKKRFITEYSGWSRIDFLKKIFPDVQFIHIVRDGRAVANSLLNIYYWKGWEGIYKWRWGLPNSELLKKLEQYDFSFTALAAVQWKMLVNNIESSAQQLDQEHYLVVRYEDLVKDPKEVAIKCLNFLNLDSDCEIFRKNLKVAKIYDANNRFLS